MHLNKYRNLYHILQNFQKKTLVSNKNTKYLNESLLISSFVHSVCMKKKTKKQDDQVFHKLFLSNLIYTKIKSTYKPIPSPFSVSSLVSSITPYRFLGFQLQGVWTPLPCMIIKEFKSI